MSRKTVLITGASRGIGKAIAVKFAKKGYNVAINCLHNEDQLLQTKKELESYQISCLSYMGDMGDANQCKEFFDRVRKQFGTPDVLVNNAGISYIGLLQDMSTEAWDRIIRTNLTSVFNCCRLAIPGMVEKNPGRSLISLPSGAWLVLPAKSLIPPRREESMPLQKLLQRSLRPVTFRSMPSPAVPLIRK